MNYKNYRYFEVTAEALSTTNNRERWPQSELLDHVYDSFILWACLYFGHRGTSGIQKHLLVGLMIHDHNLMKAVSNMSSYISPQNQKKDIVFLKKLLIFMNFFFILTYNEKKM